MPCRRRGRDPGSCRWPVLAWGVQLPKPHGGVMTTLADRPNTALVVIDAQNGVVADAPRRDAVVANIAALVERARAGDAPVVWVQHAADGLERGSAAWQLVPELGPVADEAVVHKAYGDSF